MDQWHSPTQLSGLKAEIIARNFLIKNGFKLITTNYRTRLGEIDIIMQDKKTLIFVEVRYRKSNSYANGAESITRSKQKKIIKTALTFLQKYPTYKSYRFDVIAIQPTQNGNEIDWIKDAFQVQ